jgi:hypothetical protein
MEEFKIIQGYENYSVSNLGNVVNNKTNKILKPGLNKDGYKLVGLNGKTQTVHRLVALTFIPNPENKPYVDHKDNNRTNNNIDNLRWANAFENSNNASLKKTNRSGYKGVAWNKYENMWQARITFNRRDIFLGYFKTVEDAIIARYKKAKEIQGEYINECENSYFRSDRRQEVFSYRRSFFEPSEHEARNERRSNRPRRLEDRT